MTIYITGDIHAEVERLINFKKAKSGDTIIITGDFGLLWNPKNQTKLKALIKHAEEKNIEYLFIDGNHENFTMLNSLPEEKRYNGKVGKISDKILHLKRGEIYTIYGYKFFCLGGALSIDKGLRTAYKSWWPEEEISEDEKINALKNLEKINFRPDYIITHTAPKELVKKLRGISLYTGISDPTQDFLDYLYEAIYIMNPDLKCWYFGHFHIDQSSPKNKFKAMFEKTRILE